MPFTNCLIRINTTYVDEAHGIGIVMAMYNLIECCDNYSKTSGILWQYYREQLALNNDVPLLILLQLMLSLIHLKVKKK